MLVEPIQDTAKVGSILLPESARETPVEATVIRVGTGKANRKGIKTQFEVEVGDRIVMERFGGTDVVISGKKFKLLELNEILAVIE